MFSWQCNFTAHSIFSTPSIKQIQFSLILAREVVLLQMVLPTLILPTEDQFVSFRLLSKLANTKLTLLFDTGICTTEVYVRLAWQAVKANMPQLPCKGEGICNVL